MIRPLLASLLLLALACGDSQTQQKPPNDQTSVTVIRPDGDAGPLPK